MATVMCSGGELLKVDKCVASLCETISHIGDDTDMELKDDHIPVQVSLPVMEAVVGFCEKYKRNPWNVKLDPVECPTNLEHLDALFIGRTHEEIIDLVGAADFLDNKVLYNACCWFLAKEMRKLSTKEIQARYGIEQEGEKE